MPDRAPHRGLIGRPLAALLWAVLLVLSTSGGVLAGGPPFRDRPAGADAHVVDDADVLPKTSRQALDEGLRALKERTGTDLVIYLQVKASAKGIEDATADAQALLEQWGVGGETGDGAVLMIDFDKKQKGAWSGIVGGQALLDRVGKDALETTIADAVDPSLAVGAWQSAVTQGVVALTALATGGEAPVGPPQGSPEPGATARPTRTPAPGATAQPLGPSDKDPVPDPGPPYPDPIPGVTVYDYAHVLDKDTELALAETVAAVESRTGAEIALYTQVKPGSDTTTEADEDARALMDQWGVGRRGFDDGLVILLDLTEDRCHGQLSLYAGPGFAATFLSNQDRQALYEQVMLPRLRTCDLRGALTAGVEAIEAAMTPERAQGLEATRWIDAVTGLVVTPLIVLGLIAWACWSWLRYGRDPEVTDDPSVLMPDPPPGLSPASASVVLDGRARLHALTTALVDLASRGELRFRDELDGVRAQPGRILIELTAPEGRDPRVQRARRLPPGPAERWLAERLATLAGPDGLIDRDGMARLAAERDGFEDQVERQVTREGWFREPPERSVGRWTFRGSAVLVLGIACVMASGMLPSTGLLMLGWGVIAAAIALLVIARAMPQRTPKGAMLNAWLAAYRRTLRMTMEQSRSADQVIASRAVPWLDSPDQVAVWGYALGLQDEVEALLERSVELVREQRPGGAWIPDWWVTSGRGTGLAGAAGGVAGGGAGGFSLPDFAAMAAVLATVGSSPGGSSSGGSGGFSGGSSGGGGGGAGGGF